MWGFKGNRTNSQGQSNKARGGNIKGSTIEVNGGDATQAVILKALLDLGNKIDTVKDGFDKRLDAVEKRQKHTYKKTQKISKGLEHYVANNGVPQEVKDEVKRILQ